MPNVWRQLRGDLLVVALPLGALYGLTLGRDVDIIDSGELAAVCIQLGIAHPTGYPLYTILGRMTALAFGSGVGALSGLSALAVLAACLLFVRLSRRVVEATTDSAGVGKRMPVSDWLPRCAALGLGTSNVAWGQATTNEVYGLHLLFVVALTSLGWKLLAEVRARRGEARSLLVLAYVLGLAATHHLSIVFLGPALAFAGVRWLRHLPPGAGRRALPAAACAFLVGASVWLYLPIRSAQGPALDWGDPETWNAFFRHAKGAQYSVWQFQSAEAFWRNLGGYVARFPRDLGIAPLVLIPFGLVFLSRRDRAASVYCALIALVALVWASGYAIFDLEPYYLPVDVVAWLFALAGAAGGIDRASRYRRGAGAAEGRSGRDLARRDRTRRLVLTGTALVLAILLFQAGARYPHRDRSDDHTVRYHVETLFSYVPADAIVLSAFWDGLVSPAIYLQSVENLRSDVTVVDPELLRRSWYYPQLDRSDPELLAPMRPAVSAFLSALAPFESGGTFDAGVLETRYRALIDGIATAHRPGRPTVFTPDHPESYARFAVPVPEGLAYVLHDAAEDSPVLEPPSVDGLLAAGLRPENRIHGAILEFWTTMMTQRIRYLRHFGRDDEAERWESERAKLPAAPPGATP